MRILFFSSVFPNPHAPIRGIYCQKLCEALSEDHEVRVIVPIPWIEKIRCLAQRAESDREAVTGWKGPPVRYPWYWYPPGVFRSTHGWFMWRSVRNLLLEEISTFSPGCVISYWCHPDGEVAVRAARSAGVPAIVIVGGSDVLLLTRDFWRRRRIVNVLKAADSILAVGQDLRSRVIELGIEPAKVHIHSQGIDASVFHPGSRSAARKALGIEQDGTVLLFVGNLLPVKGLDVLLESASLLRSRGLDYRLFLVGGGPLRAGLESTIRERGLAGTVSLVGPVAQDSLADWYRAADWTVLASRSEGIPNVLRESVSCGTPFIASRVGGVPEIADDRIDRLVPPLDPGALADAIFDAVSTPAACGARQGCPQSWRETAASVLSSLDQVQRR